MAACYEILRAVRLEDKWEDRVVEDVSRFFVDRLFLSFECCDFSKACLSELSQSVTISDLISRGLSFDSL